MKNLSMIIQFFAFMMAAIFAGTALATDEIICDSKTFKVSFAVGSDGYVTNMALSDSSAKYFSDVLEITNMAKKRRYVFISKRTVNVKAILGQKNAKILAINISKGKGYIKLDSYQEEMVCDWDI